ncbi:phasin family protein [Methylobacterium sp. NEAU 140]|uniref:phasin family protein n=1 Tax=Methylobacterium sp. NEAU 140 TaxID=3064945 RepID=UPI0027335202|nr:phasin family protein [Methylobacterium sp. NEAU 140]MDP4024585.1 phasin family protein [Methylobacterium sp. NEAU 140]
MLQPPFAVPVGPGRAALRGFGASVRTAQAIGIEWFDYLKQSYDDASCAVERLSSAATPADALAVQTAYLRTVAERFTARSAVFGGLYATLWTELAEAARPRSA